MKLNVFFSWIFLLAITGPGLAQTRSTATEPNAQEIKIEQIEKLRAFALSRAPILFFKAGGP